MRERGRARGRDGDRKRAGDYWEGKRDRPVEDQVQEKVLKKETEWPRMWVSSGRERGMKNGQDEDRENKILEGGREEYHITKIPAWFGVRVSPTLQTTKSCSRIIWPTGGKYSKHTHTHTHRVVCMFFRCNYRKMICNPVTQTNTHIFKRKQSLIPSCNFTGSPSFFKRRSNEWGNSGRGPSFNYCDQHK